MKTFLEPYIVIDKEWWAGLSLTSHTENKMVCRFFVINEKGEAVYDNMTMVSPRSIVALSHKDMGMGSGRYSMYIFVPEGVVHRLHQGRRESAYLCIPEEIGSPPSNSTKSPVKIRDKLYMRFNGKSSCQVMQQDCLSALDLICSELYIDYHNRNDTVVNFGDACPANGTCSGHPGMSHGRRKSIDIDYLTFKTNVTQYRGQDNSVELTTIWKDRKLLTKIFDLERNFVLWVGLKKYYGDITITVHDGILDHAYSELSREKVQMLHGIIQSDSSERYHHDTHMHVKFK